MPTHRFRVVLALVLSLSLLAASCGDDDDEATDGGGGDGGGAETTAPPLEGGGEQAMGEPVRLGLIYPDGTNISLPEVRQAAEAAAEYANDELGGIAGRPIELAEICMLDETPAGATACGNRMVESDVTAVVDAISGSADTFVPIITGAGIPIVATSGSAQASLTTEGSFTWSAGLPGTIGAAAQYAADNDAGSVAVFVTDVPSATQGVEVLGGIAFGAAGVELRPVPIPVGTADMTPQISAALGENPDAVMLIGDAAFCSAWLTSAQAIGVDQPTYIIPTCLEPSVVEAAGEDSLDGAIAFAGADPTSDHEEAVLFRSVMQEYSPDTPTEGFAVIGYQGMLSLVRATEGLEGEVTSESITEAITSAQDVPLPAGAGITFTCNGEAISILASVCSGQSLVTTLEGAEPTEYEVVDASQLFQMPGG